MRRLFFLLLVAAFLFNTSIGETQSKKPKTKTQDTSSTKKEVQISNITIRGKLKNAQHLKPYFEEDAYLQLLPLPKDNAIAMGIEDKKFIIKSEGPKSTLMKDGSFSFAMESLKPGIYLIVINKFGGIMPPGFKIESLILAKLGENGQMILPEDRVKIEIPVDAKLPLKIEVGDVYVPLIGGTTN